jgi:predicted membrane-bound spermidine synthase
LTKNLEFTKKWTVATPWQRKLWRIFTVTALIFFIPGCILGTISPVVVRLTLQNIERAGNGIGKIYAFSTLGAIAGTFMTGFVLISWMGTRNIILVMGIILMVAALGSGTLFRTARAFTACLVVAVSPRNGSLLSGWTDTGDRALLLLQGKYYTIKLTKTTSADHKTPLQAMVLDNLIHSFVALDNPLPSSTNTSESMR